MAVVVSVAKGYDLGYVWKNQAHKEGAEQTVDGYYTRGATRPMVGTGGAPLLPAHRTGSYLVGATGFEPVTPRL
jgi:hypothetical protein